MLKKICIALSLSLFVASKCVAKNFDTNINEESYRLPNNTYPQNYSVIFIFDEDVLKFTGIVLINIEILEDTDTITLHSSVDEIQKVVLTTSGTAVNFKIDYLREFLILKMNNSLKADEVITLRINFVGNIGTAFRGVYRGKYEDENSQPRLFWATHMQPTYARSVFPCYDEPHIKSKFTFFFIHDKKYKSISNMNLKNESSIPPGKVLREFKQTPLMSTYILGFVISDFKSSTKINKKNVTFTAFSRHSQIQNTKFGVKTSINALALFEKNFNATYDLEKLDQVALPAFNFGGMENHGIIFYREDSLLYEKGVTTVYRKEFTAANVVHEVCHMFIGNSLTYSWWSFLWLSEGFCKFYEYYMTHEIYPKMRLNELFAVEAMQNVLYIDSSPSTRPMTLYVETPGEIRSMFDSISYSKAASVIRMFYYALSKEHFTNGLHIYLNKTTSNPKGIAEPSHFYEALELSTKNYFLDISKTFGSWENQAGYPIIYVERMNNGDNIKITQKRFTDNIKDGKDYLELWYIPITYSSSVNASTTQFWLKCREHNFTVNGLRPSQYILLNINQTGYYRVMYDEPNWMAIVHVLNQSKFDNFSSNSRAMLIDDAGVFVETEILNMRIFLELIKYLKNETDYIPWMSATNNLIYIRRMLSNRETILHYNFKKFLQILFRNVFNHYGVKEKDNEHHEKHIRNIAINWACQAHLPECLNETAIEFKKLSNDSSYNISNDLRSTVMCNGVIKANEDVYYFLWDSYEQSVEKSERTLFLTTIGCIENERILDLFIHQYKNVQDDEWLTIIQAVYLNGPIGMNVAMRFLKENCKSFNTFINNRNAVNSLISIFRGISIRIVTREMFDDFKELMEIYELSNNQRLTMSTTIQENLNWIAKYSPIIEKFLSDYFGNGRTITASFIVMMFGTIIQYVLR